MIAEQKTARLEAFGSNCQLTIDDSSNQGDEFIELAVSELLRLDNKFSYFKSTSVVHQLNELAGTGVALPMDAEAASLFDYASALWQQSKGVFDPSIRPVTELYQQQHPDMPAESRLATLTSLADWNHLIRDKQGAYLDTKGMRIDLNSCVRPYAIDCVRKVLINAGAKHASIELNNELGTIGKQADGANWLVGVRYPRGGRAAINRYKLNNSGYAIRGDFEKALNYQDELFGHAISPVDGYPVPGLLTVAVIAEDCLTACSAANAARFKTEQAALKWLEALDLQWLAIDRKLQCHGPLAPVII